MANDGGPGGGGVKHGKQVFLAYFIQIVKVHFGNQVQKFFAVWGKKGAHVGDHDRENGSLG